MSKKTTTIRVPKAFTTAVSIIANHWRASRGPTLNIEVIESLTASALQEFVTNETGLPEATRNRLQGLIEELLDTTPYTH